MPYPEDTWYGKNPQRFSVCQPPEQTCPECDSSNLDDFDMAEDEDGRQYGTFRCLDCGFPDAPKVSIEFWLWRDIPADRKREVTCDGDTWELEVLGETFLGEPVWLPWMGAVQPRNLLEGK